MEGDSMKKKTNCFGIEIQGKFYIGISGEKKTKAVINKYVNKIKKDLLKAGFYFEVDEVDIVPVYDFRLPSKNERR